MVGNLIPHGGKRSQVDIVGVGFNHFEKIPQPEHMGAQQHGPEKCGNDIQQLPEIMAGRI